MELARKDCQASGLRAYHVLPTGIEVEIVRKNSPKRAASPEVAEVTKAVCADPDPGWVEMQRRHPDHPWLGEDPIYALSEDLIAAIEREIPDFFSEQEAAFERDLSRLGGAGFFWGCSLGGEDPNLTFEQWLIRWPHGKPRTQPKVYSATESDADPDMAIFDKVNDYIFDCRTAIGYAAADIKAVQKREREELKLQRQRAEAYSGWLVTNESYRAHVAGLRNRLEKYIKTSRSIPGRWELAESPVPLTTWQKAFLAFYRRWCLESLATWDIPIPLRSELHAASDPRHSYGAGDGLVFFLPWFMARGDQLDLQKVIQRVRFESAPEHLRPWLKAEPKQRKHGTGEIAYERLYALYRCYHLVLMRRYSKACKRRMSHLDRVIAAIMRCTDEWVKRLRQQLFREIPVG